MQAYLLQLSNPPRPGSARSVLAALTFVSSLFLPTLAITRTHWFAVTAITRLAPPPRNWFPISALFSGNLSFIPTVAPMYGIILTAFVFLLRASEASALRSADIRPGRIAIRAAKRDRTVCWRPSTAFIDRWLSYLRDCLNTTAPGGFSSALLSNAHRSVLSPDYSEYTWHSL